MITGVYAKNGERTELVTNGLAEIVPDRELDALFYFLPKRTRKRKSRLHKAAILASMGAPLIAAETITDAFGYRFFVPLYLAALAWCGVVIYANRV